MVTATDYKIVSICTWTSFVKLLLGVSGHFLVDKAISTKLNNKLLPYMVRAHADSAIILQLLSTDINSELELQELYMLTRRREHMRELLSGAISQGKQVVYRSLSS